MLTNYLVVTDTWKNSMFFSCVKEIEHLQIITYDITMTSSCGQMKTVLNFYACVEIKLTCGKLEKKSMKY